MSLKKHALFIGRWQNLHDGHLWLFNQKLKEGLPIIIMIRDVNEDENNPRSAKIVMEVLHIHFEHFMK